MLLFYFCLCFSMHPVYFANAANLMPLQDVVKAVRHVLSVRSVPMSASSTASSKLEFSDAATSVTQLSRRGLVVVAHPASKPQTSSSLKPLSKPTNAPSTKSKSTLKPLLPPSNTHPTKLPSISTSKPSSSTIKPAS